MATSDALPSPPIIAQTPKATGAAELVKAVSEFLTKVAVEEHVDSPYPTVRTLKGPFSPVLLAFLLSDRPELSAPSLQSQKPYRVATAILSILEDIRTGRVSHAAALQRELRKNVMAEFKLAPANACFELMYGALQLLAYSRYDPDKMAGYEELFPLAVSHIYSLVSVRSPDLAYHVEHFLAHAAVFISVSQSSDQWKDVVSSASLQMEVWGIAPAPHGVLAHCALNLGISCRAMPTSDFPYDLVKQVRRRVKDSGMTIDDAFEVMTLILGWRTASGLVRVLWSEVEGKYSEYEKSRLDSVPDDVEKGKLAQKRAYCSPLGIPYAKTAAPITGDGEFAVSFPGGWTIGGTSLICKAGNLRILLDCGAAGVGMMGGFDPDFFLLDRVLISHAHQDHIGGLLNLYKNIGYDGPWYGTPETGTLGKLTLHDSVRLHRDMFASEAVYDDFLVEHIMEKFVAVQYGVEVQLGGKIGARPYPSGHVPGACQWVIRHNENCFLYSGDFNLGQNLSDSTRSLEFPPDFELKNISAIAVEGTYAFSEEKILSNAEGRNSLLGEIRNAGQFPVLVPVLSLGRAQEVCAALSDTDLRVGVFGLAAKMTKAVTRSLGPNVVFDTRRPETVQRGDYDVLVASSGCLQGGPSRIFYENPAWPNIPVILTGHIFPGTPAKALVERVPRVRFSAHADADGWREYVGRFPNAKRYIIHLPAWPKQMTVENATVPHKHQEFLIAPLADPKMRSKS